MVARVNPTEDPRLWLANQVIVRPRTKRAGRGRFRVCRCVLERLPLVLGLQPLEGSCRKFPRKGWSKGRDRVLGPPRQDPAHAHRPGPEDDMLRHPKGRNSLHHAGFGLLVLRAVDLGAHEGLRISACRSSRAAFGWRPAREARMTPAVNTTGFVVCRTSVKCHSCMLWPCALKSWGNCLKRTSIFAQWPSCVAPFPQ